MKAVIRAACDEEEMVPSGRMEEVRKLVFVKMVSLSINI